MCEEREGGGGPMAQSQMRAVRSRSSCVGANSVANAQRDRCKVKQATCSTETDSKRRRWCSTCSRGIPGAIDWYRKERICKRCGRTRTPRAAPGHVSCLCTLLETGHKSGLCDQPSLLEREGPLRYSTGSTELESKYSPGTALARDMLRWLLSCPILSGQRGDTTTLRVLLTDVVLSLERGSGPMTAAGAAVTAAWARDDVGGDGGEDGVQ
jgi:hypothetical protein